MEKGHAEHSLTAERENLMEEVAHTLTLASDYALGSVHSDGHWCGELKSNTTITAEYIFLRQALGLDLKTDNAAYCRFLLSEQNPDGSWGVAPEHPGDVSTTTETYLALKILGVKKNLPAMQRARTFVLKTGGVAAVRVFTRIFLATFGLFPWDAVPQLPVELILLPSASPINIYKFASWARGTIAPLLIICHHQPVYALPNGTSAENNYLDELWHDPKKKDVPYGPSLGALLGQRDVTGFAFSVVDKILFQLNGLRSIPFLRRYARQQCIQWIQDRQETTGDWAGIFPPMHGSVYALMLEGYKLDDQPVRLAIQALENFAWEDERGKRVQACVSPVWDTALMSIGLCDAMATVRPTLDRAIAWIKDHQLLEPHGDWRVYRPQLVPGGFSFEYTNTWYPDVDDTAAVVLAQVKHDPESITSDSVMKAAQWIVGMQNPDGGWAAFDVENDRLFLNKIPFSDMDSLCDTSCADITGRILEAFGLMMQRTRFHPMLSDACQRGIKYLASVQEPNGSWFGRWGCNYIYGTSHALCGLAYFHEADPLVRPALRWLIAKQNSDGGWGESVLSYKDPNAPSARSTASQTAWALMGLLAHLPPTDSAIERGIQYLVSSQAPENGMGYSWPEPRYTGTGFPNHFYLGRYSFCKMGLFSDLLRRRPATVPTDRIIPLRFWDDLPYLRAFSHDFTFRFDDVLDVTKLQDSLKRLLEIGDWGQLGARLRWNDKGKLEYHIPSQYDEKRPAFRFTTTQHVTSINDHSLGARLPRAGQKQLFRAPSAAEFGPLVRSAESPRVLSDWVYSDRPQLHIHVVRFQDATLLTVTYPHTLMDAVGRSAFLQAWTAVLRGREDAVPAFHGFDRDPLSSLGRAPTKKYKNSHLLLAGISLVVFGIRYMLELLWFREEEHAIRVPGRPVDRMRDAARDEVALQKNRKERPFLSEGDILVSWWTRAVVNALQPAPDRPIMLMSVFNVLGLFPDWFDQKSAYIGNAIFPSYTLLSVHQLLHETLGFVAMQHRQALIEHRTQDQVQALAAIQRASFRATTPLFGKSTLLLLACSNHHKARFFQLDFSAAVVAPGVPVGERTNQLGRPSYINIIEHRNGYPTRNVLRVVGRDSAGDWWLTCRVRAEAWPAIERQLLTLIEEDEADCVL
ncbi:squalene cyclase [Aspergillus coremiiformis]|uniref:Squalene cyclase n=1 Tax=Aspergillus coremiiformis TaxID=138285 RepID=A0A5N6ZBF9_9EURO|nr:squalene cyclase [Aspergillus coremiiformis]